MKPSGLISSARIVMACSSVGSSSGLRSGNAPIQNVVL